MARLALLLAAGASAAERFLALGDWGGASLGGYVKETVYKVSRGMEMSTSAHPIDWLINTGDNFYFCGLQNVSDPQIAVDFEEPYGPVKGLDVPWYSVLGNHEYGFSVDAQIELATRSKRWVMPARYYRRRVSLGGGVAHASMLFLDTSPCVSAYRESNPSKWDPCSTEYPTCAPVSEAECKFHANILTQDCDAQFDWFQAELAAVPEDDWLIVAGHHPLDEVDVRDFASALQVGLYTILLLLILYDV